MKKILSKAISFYQFWYFICIISIFLLVVPISISRFGKEYPVTLSNVKKKKSLISDTTYTYNSQQTARLIPSAYTIELKTTSAKNYQLFFTILHLIVILLLCYFLFKIFSALQYDDPFNSKLDIWLNRIGFLLLFEWIVLIVYEIITNSQIKDNGFSDFRINEKQGYYLFFAILAFIFAKVFKKGKEYKQENDLTV